MFAKARRVKFLDDVKLEVLFQDGKVIRYDMSKLFSKYPQLKMLREDHKLFESGKLDNGGYGIIWNDELDIDATSIYFEGEQVGFEQPTLNDALGALIEKTMSKKGLYQSDLARKSHINQADIWRLINGEGNPTLAKIGKVFKALGVELVFKVK